MLYDFLEFAGFVLIVAFCAVVWWPSALLVAGAALVVVANLKSVSARKVEPK